MLWSVNTESEDCAGEALGIGSLSFERLDLTAAVGRGTFRT